MAWGIGVPCPKPEKRKTSKGRNDRAESKVKHMVRMLCVARDGDCRLSMAGFPHVNRIEDVCIAIDASCRGESEWAHMHAKRRSQTRGMAPEERHDSAHSLMLCTLHHQAYDAHKLKITALTRNGADGPLKFRKAAQ